MSEAGMQRRATGGSVYGLPEFNAADPTAYYAALKKAIEENPELRAQYDASYAGAQVDPGQPQPTTQNTLDYLGSLAPQPKQDYNPWGDPNAVPVPNYPVPGMEAPALAPVSTPKVNQLSMQSSSALQAPSVATATPGVAELGKGAVGEGTPFTSIKTGPATIGPDGLPSYSQVSNPQDYNPYTGELITKPAATPPAQTTGFTKPVTATVSTLPTAQQPQIERMLVEGGWTKNASGQWVHPNGTTGYFTSGGQFVNNTTNEIIDPQTLKTRPFDTSGGAKTTANPYANLGKDIPNGPGTTGAQQGDWRWDDASGKWLNSKSGIVYNPKTALLSDPNAPKMVVGTDKTGKRITVTPEKAAQMGLTDIEEAPPEEWSRWETGGGGGSQAAGEFLQPWQGEFSFDPTSAGFQSFNKPFNFDAQAEGYKPLNEQFGFDEAAAGFQPFNKKFTFNTEDLYKDPSYQFLLNEELKAIERKASAGGFLQSGATMKALGRYAGDYASREYANAYGRARSEFDLGRDQATSAYNRSLGEFDIGQKQTTAAYNRDLGEFGLGYGQAGDSYNRAQAEYERTKQEFVDNQTRRRQWLAAMSGLTQGGA